MEMHLYVIRDKVAEECGPVFAAVNDGIACRQYRQLLSGCPDIMDYQLQKVGDYDTVTGEVVGYAPVVVEVIA